jgi:hypothetical protein
MADGTVYNIVLGLTEKLVTTGIYFNRKNNIPSLLPPPPPPSSIIRKLIKKVLFESH